MSRITVVVPENQDKINRITEYYDGMRKESAADRKISRLQIVNKSLKAAAAACGIITTLDLIIPDPVLGLDEMALGALTLLLKSGSQIVDNKLDDISKTGNAQIEMEEISTLTEQLKNVVLNIRGRSRT